MDYGCHKYLNAVYVFSSMDDGDYFRVCLGVLCVIRKHNSISNESKQDTW